MRCSSASIRRWTRSNASSRSGNLAASASSEALTFPYAAPVNTGAGLTHHHVWDARLTAQVEGFEGALEAVFDPINVPVLGRRDFFVRFHVEFDERACVTRLTPY